MDIGSLSDGDLWFRFSDEEMGWVYILIGGLGSGGICIDRGSLPIRGEDIISIRDLGELEWI